MRRCCNGNPCSLPSVPGHPPCAQNFKDLILDYRRKALALFAASEAQVMDADTRVTPVRQEQVQHHLDPGKSCRLA